VGGWVFPTKRLNITNSRAMLILIRVLRSSEFVCSVKKGYASDDRDERNVLGVRYVRGNEGLRCGCAREGGTDGDWMALIER
jgi:hypothetical protein